MAVGGAPTVLAIGLRKLFVPLSLVIVFVMINLYYTSIKIAVTSSYGDAPQHSSNAKHAANSIPAKLATSLRPKQIVYNSDERKVIQEDAAYVLLALGAQGNQLNCNAAIESLVRYGGWFGDIYLITDRRSCFDKTVIVTNAGMDPDRLHISYVDQDFGSGGYDMKHPLIGFRAKRMLSFGMKTKIFDYIKDVKIKLVAFIDCDMVVGQKNCAMDFINAGDSWDKTSIKFTQLYRSDAGEITGVHCGTFIAHREHSAHIMRLWGEEVNTMQYDGDNDAFAGMYARLRGQLQAGLNESALRHFGYGLEDLKHMLMIGEVKMTPEKAAVSSCWAPNFYEKFIEPEEMMSNVCCLNHIAKARCNKYGRRAIQRFVDMFELKTYGGKYDYCVSPALQHFLYGWFPLSYVPFCPKFETLL